jgi:glucose dehydrogenase
MHLKRALLRIIAIGCAGIGAFLPAGAAGVSLPGGQDNGSLTGATANLAPNDPPGQWTRQARDYANTRYSPLTQVNKDNVRRLKIAWSFSDGQMYGHEGAPLVVGDTM